MRLDVDVRHAIRAREELRDVARRDRAVGAHVGAHVDPRRAAQRDDPAVALAQDLDLAVHLARVIRREQVLAAILGPFHRAAEAPRGEGNEEILGIELAAHAEAAADVGLEHVDAVLGQVHVLRQHAPRRERHLGRARYRELGARAVPGREQPARLHAHRGVALHGKPLLAPIGCAGTERVPFRCGVGDREPAFVAVHYRRQRL